MAVNGAVKSRRGAARRSFGFMETISEPDFILEKCLEMWEQKFVFPFFLIFFFFLFYSFLRECNPILSCSNCCSPWGRRLLGNCSETARKLLGNGSETARKLLGACDTGLCSAEMIAIK